MACFQIQFRNSSTSKGRPHAKTNVCSTLDDDTELYKAWLTVEQYGAFRTELTPVEARQRSDVLIWVDIGYKHECNPKWCKSDLLTSHRPLQCWDLQLNWVHWHGALETLPTNRPDRERHRHEKLFWLWFSNRLAGCFSYPFMLTITIREPKCTVEPANCFNASS